MIPVNPCHPETHHASPHFTEITTAQRPAPAIRAGMMLNDCISYSKVCTDAYARSWVFHGNPPQGQLARFIIRPTTLLPNLILTAPAPEQKTRLQHAFEKAYYNYRDTSKMCTSGCY